MLNTPLCVLLVDDDLSFQSLLRAGLARYGITVSAASHGIEALAQFRASKGSFSAVITDNAMPQMGGLELVRSVREEGYSGRIIVMSGHLEVAELRAYEALKVCGFFSKPFAVEMLAALLLRP